MLTVLVSRIIILLFGVIHPAYKSYKALKSGDPKAHLKWMMYWIVFAAYTTVECIGDLLLSWFPFYYEMKILFLVFLIAPVTNGASYLYRKFMHPRLQQYEAKIDEALAQASDKSYATLMTYGAKTLQLAATTIVTTAMKGQGILVDSLRRSYSMSDISEGPENRYRALPSHDGSGGDCEIDTPYSAGIFGPDSRRKMRSNSTSAMGDSPRQQVHMRSKATVKARYVNNNYGEYRRGTKSYQNLNDLPELPEHDESVMEEKVVLSRGNIAQSDRLNRASRRHTTIS